LNSFKFNNIFDCWNHGDDSKWKSSSWWQGYVRACCTLVLKQAKDGLLAKALDAATVQEINDVLLLNQPTRDALTFQLDDGTVKPLSIGHKNMLRALKIFADHCQAIGNPIEDWTAITKKDLMISDAARCAWQPLKR